MISTVPENFDERSITIQGKTYSFDSIKLVSIRKSQGAQNGHDVFVRTYWWVRKINFTPLSKEQAEQLGQSIANAVSSYRQTVISDNKEGRSEDVILAGNSVTITDRTLLSGGRSFPLDKVTSVTFSGSPNEDFERMTVVSFLLFFLCIAGSAALGYVVGVVLNNQVVVGYALGGLFVVGVVAFIALFAFGLTRSPGVGSITLQTPSGPEIVYKSEDKSQAEAIAESIRSAVLV